MAILHAFDRMLGAAENLTIVGYSFRDEHINVSIGRWLDSGTKHLTIIAPRFDEGQQDHGSFKSRLIEFMTEWTHLEEGGTRTLTRRMKDGFRILNVSASEGLRQLAVS